MSTKFKLFSLTLTVLVLAVSLAKAQDKTATISPRVIPTYKEYALVVTTTKDKPFPDCVEKNTIYVKRFSLPFGEAKVIHNYTINKDRTRLEFKALIDRDEAGEYGLFLCLTAPPGKDAKDDGQFTVQPEAVVEKLGKMPKDYQPEITSLNRKLASADEQLQAAKAKIAELEKNRTDLSPVEGRVTALENKPAPESLTREQVGSQINDRVAPLERRVDGLSTRVDGTEKDITNVSGANQALKNGLADLADAVAEGAERRKRTLVFWKKKMRDPRLARRAEEIERATRATVK
jgi:hypothetical protein